MHDELGVEYDGMTTYKVHVLGYPTAGRTTMGTLNGTANVVLTSELLVQAIDILSSRTRKSNRATITFSSAVIRR